MFALRCAVLAVLLAACDAKDGGDCRKTSQCDDGLVCLHWENSDEGACFPAACAEHWTGYGCELGGSGS